MATSGELAAKRVLGLQRGGVGGWLVETATEGRLSERGADRAQWVARLLCALQPVETSC